MTEQANAPDSTSARFSTLTASTPLTMSTLEIASLTGKLHAHVLRDADKMLKELGIGESIFGSSYLTEQNKAVRCLLLPKRETLILVSGYSTELRARIIDRWQKLEAATGSLAAGGAANLTAIVEALVNKALGDTVSKLVEAKFAETTGAFAPGLTAGEVLKLAGVADRRGLRGLARFASDRLRLYSARKGVTIRLAELGMSRAFVFDAATAREWLLSGGKSEIEKRVAEKRGQGILQLVPSKSKLACAHIFFAVTQFNCVGRFFDFACQFWQECDSFCAVIRSEGIDMTALCFPNFGDLRLQKRGCKSWRPFLRACRSLSVIYVMDALHKPERAGSSAIQR